MVGCLVPSEIASLACAFIVVNMRCVGVQVLDVWIVIDELAQIQVIGLLHCHLKLIRGCCVVLESELVVQTQICVVWLAFRVRGVLLLHAEVLSRVAHLVDVRDVVL